MNNLFKCNIDGNEIAYVRQGVGSPVLLVHGITTYSFIWRKIIPLLSSEYDVIAIDLLGCGNSDKPLDLDFSIKSQAEILAKVIQKLELEKIHLVAHDIGGGVAQILSVEHPELIKDVILINTVAYDFWPVQPIIAMRTPIVRQLAMSTLDFGAFRLVVKRGLYNRKFLTDELMDFFWEPMKTKLGRKAFLHFADGLNNKQLLEINEKLHSSEIPFLIIRGDDDVYLSAEIAETLHENLKISTLIKIENAGHFMMEEVPEEISKYLLNFFKGE